MIYNNKNEWGLFCKLKIVIGDLITDKNASRQNQSTNMFFLLK